MTDRPDIRRGDIIRAFGKCGAQRGGQELLRTMIIGVLAISEPVRSPEWMFVSGQLLRRDFTPPLQLHYVGIYVSGTERSVLNLSGMWQLLRRPGRSE